MLLILKHAWILFILVTLLNAYSFKSRIKILVKENPELENGYLKFFKAILLFGSIPWLIVAFGNIFGYTNSIFDFFRPRDLNPIVLIFHGYIILIWILSIWWVYFKNGAEYIERHPGVLRNRTNLSGNSNITAKEIKFFLLISILAGIAGMAMMWFMSFPKL